MRISLIVAAALTVSLAACAAPTASESKSSLTAPPPQRTALLRPAPNPQSLMDATPQAVEQALGAPAFRGRDGDAQIWRYSGTTCSVLIFFYEGEGGSVRSAHVDARRLSGGTADMPACLREVVNTPQA